MSTRPLMQHAASNRLQPNGNLHMACSPQPDASRQRRPMRTSPAPKPGVLPAGMAAAAAALSCRLGGKWEGGRQGWAQQPLMRKPTLPPCTAAQWRPRPCTNRHQTHGLDAPPRLCTPLRALP